MSPGQRNHYFMPPWQRCCRLNGWHTQDKAAVIPVNCPAAQTEEFAKVITFARQRSLMERRPMDLRDLHHGCYIVAIDRDKDTEHLNNDDQDKIVALVNYLADPNDLSAVQVWQAYCRGENPGSRKRRKWYIRSRAPEAVSRNIALDLTHGRTKDLDSLSDQEEANLARLLAQRRVYRGASTQRREGAKAQGPKNYQLNPHKKFETSKLPF